MDTVDGIPSIGKVIIVSIIIINSCSLFEYNRGIECSDWSIDLTRRVKEA